MPVARSTTSWPGISFGGSGSPSGGLSTGARAGIGAGVSVGGILIILVIGYLIFRRRTRQKQLPTGAKDTSSLDEESVNAGQEKVELSVERGNVLPYHMPELNSNGTGSQGRPTTSPADSVQGRFELPAPEDQTISSRVSRIGTDHSDTIQSPRSPGAGSSVRHSQVELEAHQIPELAPSPLFAELGRRSLPF